MIRVDLCDYILWKGAVAKVIAIADNGRDITFDIIEESGQHTCPRCGAPVPTRYTFLEDSPLFQENAVKLIEEAK